MSSLQNPGPDVAVLEAIVNVMGLWSERVHEGVMLMDYIFASIFLVARAKSRHANVRFFLSCFGKCIFKFVEVPKSPNIMKV